MNINFRKFRESDREDYLRMANSFYSPPAVLHEPDEAVFIANFNEALKPDGRLIAYIVEADGKTAGFGFSSLKFETEVGGMTLWLEELYLEPEYRGCGIGSSYFEFVKSEFGGKVKRIRLEVGPENVGAIRLYERNGFDFLDYRQMIIDY